MFDRYTRQRRKAQTDFVQAQTIQNKKSLEEKDPVMRRKHLDDLRRISEDVKLHKQFLYRSSLFDSLNRPTRWSEPAHGERRVATDIGSLLPLRHSWHAHSMDVVVDDVTQIWGAVAPSVVALDHFSHRFPLRALLLPARTERVRQEHADPDRRRPRAGDQRHACASKTRSGTDDPASARCRIRSWSGRTSICFRGAASSTMSPSASKCAAWPRTNVMSAPAR